jgi:hypothetical protein
MAVLIPWEDTDTSQIAASYQAGRTRLANADRQNLDAVWNAGLSAYLTAPLASTLGAGGTYHPLCLKPDGSVDGGLCDAATRIIAVNGILAANSAPLFQRNAAITKAHIVELTRRLANADPDPARGGYMRTLADDLERYARDWAG